MATDDPDEIVWEKKLVGRPAGTQHGRSRDDDGSSSSNLFVPGAKGVKTQAKIRDIDEDEEDSLTNPEPVYIYVNDARAKGSSVRAEIVAKVVSHFIDVAVAEAKPHVKRWWNEQALPAIESTAESTRTRIARSRKVGRQAEATELANVVDAASVDTSTAVEAVPGENTATMSSEEAQRRLMAALFARAFSDEQIRTLLNARIEDVEWKNSLEQFTPQELEAQIRLMLEERPALQFVTMFWGDQIVDRLDTLPRHQKSDETPRLTDGEA